MKTRGDNSIGLGKKLPIVAVVILVAVFLSGCLGDGGMSQVSTWKGAYHVGDFVQYYANQTVYESGEFVFGHSVISETITNISQGWYTVHVVQVFSDFSSHNVDWELMYPINASWAFNKGYDFNGRQSDMALFKFVGDETLTTSWGSLLCQHFSRIDTSIGPYDCWVCNGVVVKVEFIGGGITYAYVLKNTNLAEIMNP